MISATKAMSPACCDATLESLKERDEAMFYGYDNHPHKRVTIHHADCRECNHGEGKRGTGPTPNGDWTRGFATVAEARAAVAGLEPKTRPCGVCRPC